jgi:hypothetical protein
MNFSSFLVFKVFSKVTTAAFATFARGVGQNFGEVEQESEFNRF